MFEVEKQSTFVTDYDVKNDILYIHLQGGNPNSYSIGNPAHIDGVEWLVATADPQHITGAIILDWHRRWMDHHMMPPLPFALSWQGTALMDEYLNAVPNSHLSDVISDNLYGSSS